MQRKTSVVAIAALLHDLGSLTVLVHDVLKRILDRETPAKPEATRIGTREDDRVVTRTGYSHSRSADLDSLPMLLSSSRG